MEYKNVNGVFSEVIFVRLYKQFLARNIMCALVANVVSSCLTWSTMGRKIVDVVFSEVIFVRLY